MVVIAIICAAIGVTIVLLKQAPHEDTNMVKQTLPSFAGAVEWFNSKPLTADDLRGRVIVVQFWTYTCVNWLRTLPYVRAWADRYKDSGLVVIGVHTPEFGFEKDHDNIRRAMKDMRIEYPVAVDSNYVIWNTFANQYWPALYLIDTHGQIRYHHFGEGDYEESERVIQALLTEAGKRRTANGLVSVDPQGLEVAADWSDVRSPENFLGYERTENFSSPGGAVANERHIYKIPARLGLNDWALSGEWTIGKEAVVLSRAEGRIAYCFHARDLNLIMGPPAQGVAVRFRVFIDGKVPGAAHGGDVDQEGYGSVSAQRTYQLIRQPKPIVDRQFEIEFLDSPVETFDFTFG